jgi:hypothetical protein
LPDVISALAQVVDVAGKWTAQQVKRDIVTTFILCGEIATRRVVIGAFINVEKELWEGNHEIKCGNGVQSTHVGIVYP